MTGRELHWNIAGRDVTVRITEKGAGGSFQAGDRSIEFHVGERTASGGWLVVEGRNFRYYVVRDGDEYTVWLNGRTYRIERLEKHRPAAHPAHAATGEITATMPGKILRVDVRPGDDVSERQPVLLMESMKMESPLYAPKAGRVVEVYCQPGQVVDMGELLMVIE